MPIAMLLMWYPRKVNKRNKILRNTILLGRVELWRVRNHCTVILFFTHPHPVLNQFSPPWWHYHSLWVWVLTSSLKSNFSSSQGAELSSSKVYVLVLIFPYQTDLISLSYERSSNIWKQIIFPTYWKAPLSISFLRLNWTTGSLNWHSFDSVPLLH